MCPEPDGLPKKQDWREPFPGPVLEKLYERFFSSSAKKEMEEQFIRLQ